MISTSLQRAAANGRYGDNMIAHLQPADVRILKAAGMAGTRNPHDGALEFYPAGAMGGGSNPGGDRNGYGGRDGTGGGTGNGGEGGPAGNPMSADQLQGWKAGTTDVQNNPTQISKGKYDPDNIGRNETMGYYGSAPTPTQNALSKLGSLFGIGYHPNAINVGIPGYNETQSRISVDPLGAALSVAGMFNPMAQVASLGYKAASLAGLKSPSIGTNIGGTLAGPSSPSSAPSGTFNGNGQQNNNGGGLLAFAGQAGQSAPVAPGAAAVQQAALNPSLANDPNAASYGPQALYGGGYSANPLGGRFGSLGALSPYQIGFYPGAAQAALGAGGSGVASPRVAGLLA